MASNVTSQEFVRISQEQMKARGIATSGPDVTSFRMRRKELASANVFGRGNKRVKSNAGGLSSITDSISQPDFSMGNPAADIQSVTGLGTAAGTDSVRPGSNPGMTIYSPKKLSKNVRPGTVGHGGGTRMFQRSEYGDMLRHTMQNSGQIKNPIDEQYLF